MAGRPQPQELQGPEALLLLRHKEINSRRLSLQRKRRTSSSTHRTMQQRAAVRREGRGAPSSSRDDGGRIHPSGTPLRICRQHRKWW